MIRKNVGGRDRTIRFALAPLFFLLAARAKGRVTKVLMLYLGVALLATALARRSPANQVFGVDTHEVEASDEELTRTIREKTKQAQ